MKGWGVKLYFAKEAAQCVSRREYMKELQKYGRQLGSPCSPSLFRAPVVHSAFYSLVMMPHVLGAIWPLRVCWVNLGECHQGSLPGPPEDQSGSPGAPCSTFDTVVVQLHRHFVSAVVRASAILLG